MRVLFWLLRVLLKGISFLPLRLLYLLSDILAPVLIYLARYREGVIATNLQNSFPEANSAQRKKILRKFYHHFSDLFFEIIKLDSITETALLKRVTVSGEHIINALSAKKKGVVIVMSHSGNWEWISQRVCFAGRSFDYIGVVAKEVSNIHFDSYFTYIRMRLQNGYAQIIPFSNTAKHLAAIRHKTSMIITIADQTPHINQIQYRTNFMNQNSGVFLGPERIAKSLNYAVVFCHVQKKGRGKYNIDFELITDAPKEMDTYEVTNQHVKMLEDDITKQPEIWLWSHRRWKY